jgi:hypothetical protein
LLGRVVEKLWEGKGWKGWRGEGKGCRAGEWLRQVEVKGERESSRVGSPRTSLIETLLMNEQADGMHEGSVDSVIMKSRIAR